MFDFSKERYLYIRNTYDYNGEKIHITVRRYKTNIDINVDDGHFSGIPKEPQSTLSSTEDPITPQMIDVRGLFTPQIESQVDLTPPSTFKKIRKYDISVMEYKGTLEIWRGSVSIYFRNIGGLSPTPTPPGPKSFISQVLYCGFTGIFILVIILVIYGIFVWRRRRKS